MLREHDLLGPFERVRILVVGGDEAVDALAYLPRAGEACAGESLRDQNAEPDFHLIEPRGVRRNEVQVYVLVTGEPAIMLGLVGVQIIEDHMQLLAGVVGEHSIHEVQELHPTPTPVVPCPDQAGGHLQRGKQRGGAVTLILVIESGKGLAVGQFQPTLGALQRLDMGFSSTHNTMAFSGGFRYSPTTSAAFCAKHGSVLMHQLRRRSSETPCPRNTRHI